jgi:hypothetical protein
MPKRAFLLKITSADGLYQRELPRGTVVSVEFNDEQDGGWTSATIETAVDVTGLPTVKNGDILRCFLWHQGQYELRYYGQVRRRSVSEDDGISLNLTTEGESASVGRTMMNREIVLPGPPDVSQLWSAGTQEVRDARPDLFVQSTAINLFRGESSPVWKPFAEFNREIIAWTGNRAGWGVRRLPGAPYTPILSLDRCAQPTDSITTGRTILIPQKGVSVSDGEQDATEIRNVFWFRGGVPTNPNRVPNADFRLIEKGGDDIRNLLSDSSFEARSSAWSRIAGAGFKATGLSEGPAHSGENMVELDHTGEIVQQVRLAGQIDQYLVTGHTFRVEAWLRRESGSGPTKAFIHLYWYDASNAETLGGITHLFEFTDAVWQNYYFDIACPAGAKGFRFTVECDTPTVLVDDCSVWDASLIVPRFHELRLYGSATQETANFTQSAVRHPKRSAYAPEFALRTGGSGNDAHFGLRDALNGSDGGEIVAFDVSGNESLRVLLDIISPRTPNGLNYKNGKFNLSLYWRNKDGGATGSPSKLAIAAGAGWSVWRQYTFTATAPSNAVKALIALEIQDAPTYSGGELTTLGIPSTENGLSRFIVGGFGVRSAGSIPQLPVSQYVGLPAYPSVQYEWVADGPYTAVLKVTDVLTIADAEYSSIAEFGECPYPVENESVTSLTEATFLAQSLSYAYALQRPNGSLTLEGDTRQFTACAGIRLRGARGRALSSAIIAIKHAVMRYDGKYSTNLNWGFDPSDPFEVFNSFLVKRQTAQGAGAGGGYYTGPTSGGSAPGGGGGGGGSGLFYWGSSPRTSSDATLHDAYTPVGGVHVTGTDRTAWDGAAAEVLAARDSAALSTVFGSLDARLENAETLISGVSFPLDSAAWATIFGTGDLRLEFTEQMVADALISAAYGTAYGSLDARLEASETEVINARNSAAYGNVYASVDARLEATETEIVAARNSAVYSTTYASIDARFEAVESEVVTARNSAAYGNVYASLDARIEVTEAAYVAALNSAVYSTTFASVDARLENVESEVVTARNSAAIGNVYSTLDGRLEAIETATIEASQTVSTGSIANGATANVTIPGGHLRTVYRVQFSAAGWARVYGSTAARTADNARTDTTPLDPTDEHECELDVKLPSGNLTWNLASPAHFVNHEGPFSDNVYLAFRNDSGATASIDVTFVYVPGAR